VLCLISSTDYDDINTSLTTRYAPDIFFFSSHYLGTSSKVQSLIFKMPFAGLLPLLALLSQSLVLASPTTWLPQRNHIQPRNTPITNHTLSPSTLYEFPDPTWLENFAVHSNGQLVITLAT